MCITCHQGPLFTNHGFHNVAAPDPAAKKPEYMLPLFYALIDKPDVDRGRLEGIQQAMDSEFNCFSEYSDAAETDCAELKFANKNRNEIIGAFKVPTLRNITKTAPYMHAGQFTTLADVLKHYNTVPRAAVGHSELLPINLTQKEREQIEGFLHSLSSPPDAASELLRPPGR
jgi:cytochrome c peroxidase